MGCEQSLDKNRALPDIDEDYRRESQLYQSVLKEDDDTITNIDAETMDHKLAQYKKTEEKIRKLELNDPVTIYYIKKSHLQNVEQSIKNHNTKIELIRNNNQTVVTEKLPTVKTLLVQIGEKNLSRDEQDRLARANRLEIALAEVEMMYQEKAITETEVMNLREHLAQLRAEYQRQDDIIEQLCINKSTPEELQLQKQLTELESKRIHISDVFERWKEARSLVAEASRNFSLAISHWIKLTDDPDFLLSSRPLVQYEIGEEIRDQLVTALQCLTTAHLYIKSDFPYCSTEEIIIVEKAISYLFVDMKTTDRRKHAESCYKSGQKRAVALYAWLDMTIQVVIEPELKQCTKEINGIVRQLRQFRIELIKLQFPNFLWKEEYDDADSLRNSPDNGAAFDLTDPETQRIFSELDLGQLAPLPARQELFGKQLNEVIGNYKSRLQQSISSPLENHLEIRRESLDRQKQEAEQLMPNYINSDNDEKDYEIHQRFPINAKVIVNGNHKLQHE